jgi:hypothetical protein
MGSWTELIVLSDSRITLYRCVEDPAEWKNRFVSVARTTGLSLTGTNQTANSFESVRSVCSYLNAGIRSVGEPRVRGLRKDRMEGER